MNECKEKVFRGFHYFPCGRKATKDGYCGIHHPDKIAARDAKQKAKWDAEWHAKKAKQEEVDRKLNSHAELLAALEGLVDPDKHGGAETFFARYEAARAAIAKAKS